MALRADNADLPPEPRAEGNPPTNETRFGHLIAQSWADADLEPHISSRDGQYIRLGWAGKCARDIGYRLNGVEPSNPTDIGGYWSMGIGSMIHDLMDKIVPATYPNAQCERPIGAEYDDKFGFPASGRADLFLVDEDGKRTLVEYKTVGGFKFKKQIGARGAAEGPDTTAIMQAALYAHALDADEVVLVSISFEKLSQRELDSLVARVGGEPLPQRKFCAEWVYSREDLADLTGRELQRLGKVVAMVGEGVLPPRSIPLQMPARARVTDPSKGHWTVVVNDNVMQSGETFFCGYCDYRTRCTEDGAS